MMARGVVGGVRSLGLGLTLTVWLAGAGPAVAAPIVAWVTSTADSGPGSLRQVIANAVPGTLVRVGPELAYRTITLSSELVIDKDLVIDGTGAPGVTISGNDAVRVFNVGNSGATCGVFVALRGLRITHGFQPVLEVGAGVWTCATSLNVERVSFEGNESTSGGGLYHHDGTTAIRDSVFTANGATVGAAIFTAGDALTMERVTIAGNSGGTILSFVGPSANLSNVTIHGNSTAAGTTLSVMTGASVSIESSTIAANYNTTPSIHTITNVGTLEIRNSIVSNSFNCHPLGTAPVNLGNNLEFGGGTCGFTSGDPQLGTLGLYGSDLVPTVPIAAGSPARNAGGNVSCPIDDGRAKRRARSVGDPCDIGAFEYDGPLTATVTNLNDAGAGSLRQALADVGSGGTIDFQSGLSGDITIDSTLVAPRPITIAGPGHATLAIARNTGAGNFRLMETGSGSGSYCHHMAISLKGLTFRDGDAGGAYGGAIFNCANLSIEDARFTNNAAAFGAAVFTESQSRLKLERVRVEDQVNGALSSVSSAANVYYAVILDSSIDGPNGDGVQFDGFSALLRNVTIVTPAVTPVVTQADRTAFEHVTLSGDVGFFSISSHLVSIANSIVIGTNTSFGGACITSGPHYESRGGNVFQGTCAALAADASTIAANPQLGALALHAPGVVKTRSLTLGSPAIDRGIAAFCTAADARGMTRPQGAACDAGAFEAHAIAIAPGTLPQITAGTPLTVNFTQTGAIGATTFASGGPGPLPAGLMLAANGAMTGTPAAGSHTFVVTVTDATGVGAAQSYTLIVNGAPTVTGLIDRSVNRNGVLGPLTFNVGDDLTGAGALTITASSSNQALVPDASLIFGGSGAERTLTVTPAPGASGTAIITVTVSDGLLTKTSTFNVIVMPVYYLAEGATGDFFDLDLLIANPNNAPAPVDIKFLLNDGVTIDHPLTIAPTTRVTIAVDEIAGLEAAAVSSVVTSTSGLPIVVERTMRWDATGYGSHTEAATQGAAPTWYFAEGAQGFFSTFILLANPNAEPATAHATYFREGAGPLTREYPLPALSRVTIDAGADTGLVGQAFGARIEFDRPGIAERSMYFHGPADSAGGASAGAGGGGGGTVMFTGGHASAGVTSPSTSWFLAEGATGSYFTTFLLLANPQSTPTSATLTYLPSSGTPVTRTVDVPASGRTTVNIALEDPSLAGTAVATRVESILPIVVERSQYWPSPVWHEAHNSFGATAAATRWGLAEGRVGGTSAWQTYILLANPGDDPAEATITFLRENGTTVVKSFTVPATSRYNVALTGADSVVPELVDEAFGAVIESTLPIVVERSLYNNSNGVVWAAGSNAVATPLR
jgi:hypothetical protein